jgi:hypothetical protein
VSRAVFGVLAIWCLGCTSFDVILDQLVHGARATSGCVMGDDAPVPSGHDATSSVQESVARAASGCGCDHCVAVQPVVTALALPPHPTPETIEQELGSALNVFREPLVPPPIARATA